MFLAFVAAAIDAPLYLVCKGASSARTPVESSSVVAQDNYGRSATASGSRTALIAIDGTVDFSIAEGAAQLHLSPSLLRGMRNGKNGWFPVKSLIISEREITGKVQLGILEASSFRIDRYSGEMTSSGGFTATCEPTNMAQRKF